VAFQIIAKSPPGTGSSLRRD